MSRIEAIIVAKLAMPHSTLAWQLRAANAIERGAWLATDAERAQLAAVASDPRTTDEGRGLIADALAQTDALLASY